MKVRTERMDLDCDCGEIHGDGEGTRFFGIPAWSICFALIVSTGVALLAYTAAVR